MQKLPALTRSWGQAHFDEELLEALTKLQPVDLPLNQLAQFSGFFDSHSLQFSILNKHENEHEIRVKLGVFFQEIASPCPCSGEDPETLDGHCEILLQLDKQDGTATFELL